MAIHPRSDVHRDEREAAGKPAMRSPISSPLDFLATEQKIRETKGRKGRHPIPTLSRFVFALQLRWFRGLKRPLEPITREMRLQVRLRGTSK